MEKDDKGSTMIRMGVNGWMFLLVPAYPGCLGSKAVKRSLLLLYFIRKIYLIVALEMASQGNQHCDSCIGALLFRIWRWSDDLARSWRRCSQLVEFCGDESIQGNKFIIFYCGCLAFLRQIQLLNSLFAWYFVVRFPEHHHSLALSMQHLLWVSTDELVYCKSDGSSTVVCSALLNWNQQQVTCRYFGCLSSMNSRC